jgi:hypothetical protein
MKEKGSRMEEKERKVLSDASRCAAVVRQAMPHNPLPWRSTVLYRSTTLDTPHDRGSKYL